MRKKVNLLFVSFFVIFTLISVPEEANAEYVDDCLENPENCEDPLQDENETQLDDADNTFLVESDDNSGSLALEIVKLFFALLLVLALIYLFLYFLKRKNKLGGRIESLENIGGISVGQNKSIQLIRLADRLYILGVGEDITLLEEVQDPALIQKIMQEKESKIEDFSAASYLSSLLNKKATLKKKDDNQFKDLFQNEMENLKQNRKNILNRRKED